MKYNQNRYNCQEPDPRLLGMMLGQGAPVDTGCQRRQRSASGSCGRTARAENMMQDGCCEITEQNHCDEAYLASSCGSCPSLAMAYSPFQHFHGLYETDEALHRGTLFVELDKPWKAGMSR